MTAQTIVDSGEVSGWPSLDGIQRLHSVRNAPRVRAARGACAEARSP